MTEKPGAHVFGIVGGIGSGKSFIAHCLEDLGAKRINADTLSHEALQREDVQKQLVELWGPQILENGQISRPELAKIVFGETEETRQNLKQLESIIHPIVRAQIESFLEQHKHPGDVVVLDIPLLWKSPAVERCHTIIFVDTSLEERQQRVAQTRSWTPEELAKRESLQLSIEEKKKMAHAVIVNSGSTEETKTQVQQCWQKIFS